MQQFSNQNIVITESCKNLRALGRNALKGKWVAAIIALLVYCVVTNVPSVFFDTLFGTNILGDYAQYSNSISGIYIDVFTSIYNSMPKVSALSGIYAILVTGPMELGITIFFLAQFRKYKTNTTDVFLGFERFAKAVGLYVYIGIFVFLWSLLFIVPGIIAALRYSQAYYILADDPTKGIRQCVNESKMMMKGNKATFFVLNLSFLGWLILSAIAVGILQEIGYVVITSELGTALCVFASSLLLIPVEAYIRSTHVGFYEILAGHLIGNTSPNFSQTTSSEEDNSKAPELLVADDNMPKPETPQEDEAKTSEVNELETPKDNEEEEK